MKDNINLIEKIAEKQAEIVNDLELLKNIQPEFAQYIEQIAQHQQCNAKAIQILRCKIETGKGESTK